MVHFEDGRVPGPEGVQTIAQVFNEVLQIALQLVQLVSQLYTPPNESKY